MYSQSAAVGLGREALDYTVLAKSMRTNLETGE
jgi:hypothetical protein